MPTKVNKEEDHPERFIQVAGSTKEGGSFQGVEEARVRIHPSGTEFCIDQSAHKPVSPIALDELLYQRVAVGPVLHSRERRSVMFERLERVG